MKKVILRWQHQGEGREGSWSRTKYARNCTNYEAQKYLHEAVEVCYQHLAGYDWEVYFEDQEILAEKEMQTH